MGRKLRYLGPSERAEIERLHNGGAPAAVIAERVGSHVATIYRELSNAYTGTVDEYDIDALTGEIRSRDWELDDFDLYEDDQTQVSVDNVITAEQAKAPSTATVVKCELDEDDGRWVHELELRDGRTEYECDINAVIGVILDWEVDRDD